ncbi:MAG: VanZ family protein [Clostridiales bacterium]|nr:VanZ family protein [Clostridiales bacterium]
MTLLREGALIIEFALLAVYAIAMIFKKVKPDKFFFNLAFGLYVAVVIAVCFFPIKFSGTVLPQAFNNFIPFKSIADTVKQSLDTSNLYGFLTIAGNFVMLMPFGVFFHFCIKNQKNRFLAVFLISLSIEAIQFIIGLLIGYNYRSVDIDDVILNTVGGIAAILIFDFAVKKYKGRKSVKKSNVQKS